MELNDYLKFDNVATQEFKEEYVKSMFDLIQTRNIKDLSRIKRLFKIQTNSKGLTLNDLFMRVNFIDARFRLLHRGPNGQTMEEIIEFQPTETTAGHDLLRAPNSVCLKSKKQNNLIKAFLETTKKHTH